MLTSRTITEPYRFVAMVRAYGPARTGSSLCEVLMALVMVSTGAAWTLQACAAAERAAGRARASRAALHRAERALADIGALPCDSATTTRTINEPRWRLSVTRTPDGTAHRTDVLLVTTRGDSLRTHRAGWCT